MQDDKPLDTDPANGAANGTGQIGPDGTRWQRPPPTELDPLLRDAVADRHRSPVPPFESLWQRARAERDAARRRRRRRHPLSLRLLTAGAMASAAALALLLVPTAGENDPHAPAEPALTTAAPVPPRTAPEPTAGMAALMSSNLIYARTDVLLPPRNLLYGSQPAYYLSYDPVAMEVIP